MFSDEREIEIIKALHSIIKPTARAINIETAAVWKITIQDSIDSFILFASTLLEFEDKIQKKIAKYSKYNVTLQPLIFYIKNSEKPFGIYLDGKYFLFDKLSLAIDLCFKIFFVFDLKYPIQSQFVWNFFGSYVYEMENIEENSSLISFVSKLRNC